MKDDQLDDLKQYIDSRVSQSEVLLTGKIDKLELKMDDGFGGVGEAIEAVHEQNTHFDERLTKLEQAAWLL